MAEASQVIETESERLDLVISSARLPDESSADLVARVRALCACLPVVFICGSSQTVDTSGMSHTVVLTKPFAMADLASTARGLLEIGQ